MCGCSAEGWGRGRSKFEWATHLARKARGALLRRLGTQAHAKRRRLGSLGRLVAVANAGNVVDEGRHHVFDHPGDGGNARKHVKGVHEGIIPRQPTLVLDALKLCLVAAHIEQAHQAS